MSKILETGRLILRKFRPEDEDAMARMYSDIDVMRYIGTGVTIGKEQVKKSVNHWIEYEKKFGFSNWVVTEKDNDIMIGKCGFNWIPDNSDIEISYLFDKRYWGKGYATEVAGAVLKHGFETIGLNRVVGFVYPQNKQSIKVLKKIGLVYEKDVVFWGITFHLFSLIKPETLK